MTRACHQISAPSRPLIARLMLSIMLASVVATAHAQPVRYEPPVVQEFGNFGYAVEPFGEDRFVVSSLQIDVGTNGGVGQAYLMSLGGATLTTFSNPVPAPAAFFGNALGAVGTGAVIVGANETTKGMLTNTGEAYLFNTNGALLTTFTNPFLHEFAFFGDAVGGLGTDRVVIGAGGADAADGTFAAGRAYVFRTNGALLTTITNPVVVQDALFGFALAVVGSNRLLIGAYGADQGATIVSGRAYLYSTNGALITTFSSPSPMTNGAFGAAVAALDVNRVIIGAYGVSRGGFANAGEAYLFRTNGVLLATFTNPAPALNAAFGGTVTAVGSNLVLIGADGAKGGSITGAGAAYLFATNGVLVATYTNPAPVFLDQFGWSVAAMGTNRILIGAPNSGRAFLYATPGATSTNVTLTLSTNATGQQLRWTSADAYILQDSTNLAPPVVWRDTTNVLAISGPTNTVPFTSASGPPARFFRLRRL